MIPAWFKRIGKRGGETALITALLAIAPVLPAGATVPVIDIANLSQNVLTAARTLEEVNNQITQIQQGIAMLENQTRNLRVRLVIRSEFFMLERQA